MSTMPTIGRRNQIHGDGDHVKDSIPAAVKISVPITIGITPSRSARTPQANFPNAPPAKRRVRLNPTSVIGIPFRKRRNGRKVSKAVRTEISMTPMVNRAEKLFRSRIQPLGSGESLTSGSGNRGEFLFSPAKLQRMAPAANPPMERVAIACLQPQRLIIKVKRNGRHTFPMSPEKL